MCVKAAVSPSHAGCSVQQTSHLLPLPSPGPVPVFLCVCPPNAFSQTDQHAIRMFDTRLGAAYTLCLPPIIAALLVFTLGQNNAQTTTISTVIATATTATPKATNHKPKITSENNKHITEQRQTTTSALR